MNKNSVSRTIIMSIMVSFMISQTANATTANLECLSKDKSGADIYALKAQIDSNDTLYNVKFADQPSAIVYGSAYTFAQITPTQKSKGYNTYELGSHWTNTLILPVDTIQVAQENNGTLKAHFGENYYGAQMTSEALCIVK